MAVAAAGRDPAELNGRKLTPESRSEMARVESVSKASRSSDPSQPSSVASPSSIVGIESVRLDYPTLKNTNIFTWDSLRRKAFDQDPRNATTQYQYCDCGSSIDRRDGSRT